jgi:hypothetical protein
LQSHLCELQGFVETFTNVQVTIATMGVGVSRFAFAAFLDDKASSFNLSHDFVEDVVDDGFYIRITDHVMICPDF